MCANRADIHTHIVWGWKLTVAPFPLLIFTGTVFSPSSSFSISLHSPSPSTFLPHLPSACLSPPSLFSISLPPALPSAHLALCLPSLTISLPISFALHHPQPPPTPLLIPASPSFSLFLSPPCSPYISTHTQPRHLPPILSLSVVTAACLMVRLLLSRFTKRRPGEQQPRLTPPNRWPYQDWQPARPWAIADTRTRAHEHR